MKYAIVNDKLECKVVEAEYDETITKKFEGLVAVFVMPSGPMVGPTKNVWNGRDYGEFTPFIPDATNGRSIEDCIKEITSRAAKSRKPGE